MQITIVSRIFDPEPSAASFRLGALASALSEHDNDVTVLTVRPPEKLAALSRDDDRPYRVRRSPVLRDGAGYVRGYLQYLSFDVPLFFRILFGRRADAILAEPPPTTGFVVRIAAAIRRTPYVYYAADIWSDGASQTGAAGWVVSAVKRVELFAMRGARTVLSVSDTLTSRLAALGITGNVLTVGNGVDTRPFVSGDETCEHYSRTTPPEFVYAGTASEWHGAMVFVDALPRVLSQVPDAKIRFIGSGSEVDVIQERAKRLGVSHAVTVESLIPPAELSPVLRGATAALASIRPGLGNEFTFPTKLYASTLSGTPAIFAGVGPAVDFLRTKLQGVPLGISVALDPEEVADAMISIATQDDTAARREHCMSVVAWGLKHVSLSAVSGRIIEELERIVEN